jgi:uroporphyrin-III C-methyltransferase / precorrin-2 dehydrogenase / sirohydrochlorin ferrochelatase
MTDEHAGGRGEVWLVGAGPGSPDLLTLRAVRLMEQAEVVVYDRLVGPDILDLVPPSAERVFVGKMRERHVMPQTAINALLVELARAGRKVLRLKGGDPFVFGRGGEELEALAQAGIRCQVVPGVTAALGCAASARIPLTHRDHAQTLVMVTGHTKDGRLDLNWRVAADPEITLVVYMGIRSLDALATGLIERGRPPSTPAALIANGTYEHQQIVTGTLETLPGQVYEIEPGGPALIVVGKVVRLQPRLAWFRALAAEAPARLGAQSTPLGENAPDCHART